MTRRWVKLVCLLPAAIAIGGATTLARARVDGTSGYSKAQTYSGALRYVRVELGYDVIEKDPEAAYLIFKYATPGQPKNAVTGTLEVIEVSGGGVKIFVSLPRMPEYHERVFRDGLLKKLREEYGSPTPPKKPPEPGNKPSADKPAPSPDAG